MNDNSILDHPLGNYGWRIRHEAGVNQTIADWYRAGHDHEVSIGGIGHINIRAGKEFERWQRQYGTPLTLRKLLQGQWPITIGDVRQWKGNFLAFAPNWEMGDNRQSDCGLFYPRFDTVKRMRFRVDYTAAGYTHLPLTVMRDAQPTKRLNTFVNEFRQSGMVLCHMIFTDNRDQPLPNDFEVAKRYVKSIVPQFANKTNIVNSIAWEMPETTQGSGDPIGTPPRRWGWSGDGESVLKMAALILKLAPKQRLYVHWRPDWWGPADMDERRFCKQFAALGGTGVLYQSRWRDNDTDVYRQAFELPLHGTQGVGVCGRVEAAGLDFVWFEFARHVQVHARRMQHYAKDGRGHGYC